MTTTAVWDDTKEQVVYSEAGDCFVLIHPTKRLDHKIAQQCPRVIVKANGRGGYSLDGYGFTAYNVSGPWRFKPKDV